MIISLSIRNRRVLLHSQVPSVSPNRFFRVSQKRTVFSLVNKLSSKMKETLYDSRSKSKLKQPDDCIQSSQINFDNRNQSPLLKAPLVKSSTTKPIHVLTQKILGHQTSVTHSTEKVFLPNLIHSSIRNNHFHVTDLLATGNTDSVVRLLRRKFKKSRFSSSGLDCLKNAGDFVINKNVLHRGFQRVPQILGNVSSSPTFFSADTALFLSIFIYISIPEEICPLHIFTIPTLVFSDMFPIVKEQIRDCYVNYVCITHKTSSPCECGEPINEAIKAQFPQILVIDPLHIHEPGIKTKVEYTIYMLGSVLLLLTLMDKIGNSPFPILS